MKLIGTGFAMAVLLLTASGTGRLNAQASDLSSSKGFADPSLRQSINFNRDWKFQLGDDTNAVVVAFDDSRWNAVGLPHSFSEPYFASSKFYIGYGWYRKHFTVPKELARQTNQS